jgi:phage tail sheath protein FI
MPEYLAPGVYVEEIEIGPKPIEGVSTSTAGFLGLTERGPASPKLITSYDEFDRLYGGFRNDSYLAYSIDGFFRNGGKRCYVARIHNPDNFVIAKSEQSAGEGTVTISAIGPGEWGNRIYYKIENSTLFDDPNDSENFNNFFKMTIIYYGEKIPAATIQTDVQEISNPNNPIKPLKGRIIEEYDNVSIQPTSTSYYKTKIDGISQFVRIYDNFEREKLNPDQIQRPGGSAGIPLTPLSDGAGVNSQINTNNYDGVSDFSIADDPPIGTGLKGLAVIDDISIILAPDDGSDSELSNKLIEHCSSLKDRFAVLNTQVDTANQPGNVSTPTDNKYAAIYFPWVNIIDPVTGDKKLIPPSGHIAGIYARTDIERGVHKAPANESIRGVVSLQVNIDKGKQEILNPKGVNVIRYFPGRGNLVWGARTISKDPLWKYINVRRLFIFIEKSVERSTQWAVFEPNNERLWSRIKATLTQFLTAVWKDGALMGTTPEEGFFVKCDRTTMTQSDIDNGKLIVIIGIAPTKPAEFVIFRFAQTQAGAEVEEI